VVVGGSGLSIGVGYTSRHWGVGISLNDVWSRYDCRPRYEPLICSTPVVYTAPVVYTQPVVVERPVVYTTPVVVTQTGTAWTSQPVQAVTPVVVTPPAAAPAASPAPASPQASPPPTDFERGVLALQANDIAYSIAALRKHLREHADDARAMRVLAVALLADKQADDAAGLMRAALRTDAKLAGEPVSPLGLGFSERRFRDLVTRAVDQANNVNTSGAWLLVATLMQAEGRDDKALGMLERARAQGLERDLYDAMVVELKR
jgi:hypothetical protein